MSALATPSVNRGPCDGAIQIIRFNWPMYLASLCAVVLSGTALFWFPMGLLASTVCVVAMVAATWWTVGSILASHWVYDRSGVMDWQWLAPLMTGRSARWLSIHVGLDYSAVLRRLFPRSRGQSLDVFDSAIMSEPSIRRARAQAGLTLESTRLTLTRLPVADASMDTILLLFAAHEIRNQSLAARFFRELRRVLAPGGQIIMVEHVRDASNFLAFGPGFLHFLPDGHWRGLARHVELRMEVVRRFTPLVTCYRLTSPRTK